MKCTEISVNLPCKFQDMKRALDTADSPTVKCVGKYVQMSWE